MRDQLVYLGQLCGRGAKDVNRSVDTWLERLGLAGRAADRLDALSHGNQQRVQLIAALVNAPDLLVLDEPFSGVDPIAMGAMSELLCDLAAGGATVLFSSHQLDLVEDLCQDVVMTGVLEGKASRVVEVLLARIPARALLAGKIAGIGLLGLAQIGVTALAALVAVTTVQSIDVPAVRGTVLAEPAVIDDVIAVRAAGRGLQVRRAVEARRERGPRGSAQGIPRVPRR